MRERGDRRQRIVQFVADHADHLLPDRHLLGRHLARQLLEEQQPVRLAVQREVAARQVEDVRLGAVVDREQRVRAALDRLAQRLRRTVPAGSRTSGLRACGPCGTAAGAAMLPKMITSSGLVSTSASGVVCTTVSSSSSRWCRSSRSRRSRSPSVLYSVVRSPISSAADGRHADAEVVVLQAADAVGHRADAAAPAGDHAPREPGRERDGHEQRGAAREPRRGKVMLQREREGNGDDRHDAENHGDAAGQRAAGARLVGHQPLLADVRPGSTGVLRPSFSMRR